MARIQNDPWSWGVLAGLLVFLVGLVANVSCVPAGSVGKLEDQPDYTAYYNSAVQITAHCTSPEGEASWFGSGVIVSPTRLLTAGHIAEHASDETCSFVVEDVTGVSYLAYAVKVFDSSEVDLASMELLSYVQQFKGPPIRFGAMPKIGDRVCTATAYPRREERCGQVMMPKAEPPGDIIIDMVVEPGNSGSGLYNSYGELVGIVVHTYPNRGNGQYVTGGATSLFGYWRDLLK